jgi:hypothetical protein
MAAEVIKPKYSWSSSSISKQFQRPPALSQYSASSNPYAPLINLDAGWDVSPIVLEDYKLIFFTIPKTGCTVFKQLFRRMMGYQDWPMDKDPNYPHNPQFNGLKYLYHYSSKRAAEILTSPDWTRAIFVRDPKDRLLSAYLDKALHGNGTFIKRKCCGIKPPPKNKELKFQELQKEHQQKLQQYESYRSRRGGNMLLAESFSKNGRRLQQSTRSMNALHSHAALMGMQAGMRYSPTAPAVPWGTELPRPCSNLTFPENTITFETFVKEFIAICQDPHWLPQAKRIDKVVWKHINFVGSFDRVEQDTRRMLERIGAWEEFGATDWPGVGGSIFSKNSARHKTSARDHLGEFYTPELEQVVYRHYQIDYEHPHMNLTKPSNYYYNRSAHGSME